MRNMTLLLAAALVVWTPFCRAGELSRQERVETANRLYREGKELVEKGDYTTANERFAKAQEMLGEQAISGGQAGQPERKPAMPDAENIRHADFLYNQAVAFIKNEEIRKAQVCLEEAVGLNPLDKDAYYNLGVIYEVYLKDKNAAAGCYLRYLLLETDREKAAVVKAWIDELKKGAVKK